MCFSARQRGSALLVSLVFLLLLTMIGVSSIQDSTLQERMAGNNRDQGVAFQAAEAALRAGEKYLQGAVIGPFLNSQNSQGLYVWNHAIPADWKSTSKSGWIVMSENSLGGVSSQPNYVIEELSGSGQTSLATDEPLEVISTYRITARGYGVSADSRSVLQSTYRR